MYVTRNRFLPMAVTTTLCDPATTPAGIDRLTSLLKLVVFFRSTSTGVLYSFGTPSGYLNIIKEQLSMNLRKEQTRFSIVQDEIRCVKKVCFNR